MEKNDVLKFVDFCKRELNFTNLEIGDHYKSLSICVIDCVYSLRAQYFSTTVPVIKRYAEKYMNGDMYADNDKLTDLIKHIDEAGGCEAFANDILKNRQKLSFRLKSEICYELADKLSSLLNINTVEEFRNYNNIDKLDSVMRSIKGIGDAAINYMFMLAGDPNKCKPDIHIHNCVKLVLGEYLSNEECQELFTEAVSELKGIYPGLTVRSLDYLIWNKYQVGNK